MHPTGGTLRVFKHFAWLEVGSAKVVASRPAHQRVTQTVRKTRGFFSATGILKFGLANYLVLQMVEFIGLGSFSEGVFFKIIMVG